MQSSASDGDFTFNHGSIRAAKQGKKQRKRRTKPTMAEGCGGRNADWSSRRDLSQSFTTSATTITSCSAASAPPGPYPRARRTTLEDHHAMLTDEIIELKFNIAEQRGKQDHLRLDWQQLHSEQSEIRAELLEIEEECDAIKSETDQTNEGVAMAKQRLDLLIEEGSPIRQEMDEVRNEYDAAQAELKETEGEMGKVKYAGDTLRATIEDLKGNSVQISIDKAKLATEGVGVEREIEELREEIAKIQRSVQDAKAKTEEQQAELTSIRNESARMARHNDALESKIAAREEAKKK